MINRAAIILKYKEPAVNWINEADPYNDNPGYTVASVNEERTVYLIRNEDADGPDIVDEWLKLNYETLFEDELDSWYTDEGLWPAKRDFKLFNAWFDVECHDCVTDTVGTPIEDDEVEY